MHDFALVSEGPTDHTILKNILLGYFKNQREPDIHREHPDPQAEAQYGGWTLVLQYLRAKKFRQAFQLNRWLIVQVDTDVAEDRGFDLPRQNAEGPLALADFVGQVVKRLQAEIGAVDLEIYGERFIFAIGVEQLECWALPLWFKDARGEQTVNCTKRMGGCNQLRDELKAKNCWWIQGDKKDTRSYDLATREYRKRDILRLDGPRNPSLALFLKDLDRRKIQLPDSE